MIHIARRLPQGGGHRLIDMKREQDRRAIKRVRGPALQVSTTASDERHASNHILGPRYFMGQPLLHTDRVINAQRTVTACSGTSIEIKKLSLATAEPDTI